MSGLRKPYEDWTDEDRAIAASAISAMLTRGKVLTPPVEDLAAKLLADFSRRLRKTEEAPIEIGVPAEQAPDAKALETVPDSANDSRPDDEVYFERLMQCSVAYSDGGLDVPTASDEEQLRLTFPDLPISSTKRN
ncbi:MAG: hypothetical protein WCT36_01575 [Candidatus Gracilibacteria bacterium]|jgi:hypothetical protein